MTTEKAIAQAMVEAVRQGRMARGLSIRAASKEIGVGFATLARLERGEGLPDAETQARLQRWILTGSGGEPRAPRARVSWSTTVDQRLSQVEDELRSLRRRVDGE